MANIDKTFTDRVKAISFIELKEGKKFEINGYILKGGLPLPVITDNLLKDLNYGVLNEEVDIKQVIDGIIFLVGADSEFPHIEKYIDILISYDPNIEEYIFYRGMQSLENDELLNAGIYFRANLYLNKENIRARLNYGLILESMGKKLIETDKPEEGEEYLIKSTNEIESILDVDDTYPLAYYKLGYHYKYYGQYLKAKITWNKLLIYDNDENRKQEIREQIDIIDADATIESGMSYLTYNEFGKALDMFFKLFPKHENNWNVNYLIGLCYKGMENYEAAIEYLSYAMELNEKESDIYNELGIVYFLQGMIIEAIKIFNKGIEDSEADYKLYFNRGLGYIQLGEYPLALKDVSMAYELEPYDENVRVQKEELENLISSI